MFGTGITATPSLDRLAAERRRDAPTPGIERQGSTMGTRNAYTGTGHYIDPEFSGQFPAKLGMGDNPDLLNWMMFTAYEITGGFEEKKIVKFGNPSGSVALPIPPGIQDTIEQNWSQSTAGLGAMITQRALQATPRGSAEIQNFIAGAFGSGEVEQNTAELPVVDTSKAKGDFAAEGIGMALKKAGIAESTQYNTGVRALDQLMMSYGGPAFRNFTWTFPLKPLNADDSQSIDDIVNFFKYRSSPQSSNAQFTRLYKLPNVFEIDFLWGPNAEPHTRLPQIGHCALTNINIQYGGDIFRTYNDPHHSPVQVNLSLSFKEMELRDRQYWGKTGAFSTTYSAGADLPQPVEGEVDANPSGL